MEGPEKHVYRIYLSENVLQSGHAPGGNNNNNNTKTKSASFILTVSGSFSFISGTL